MLKCLPLLLVLLYQCAWAKDVLWMNNGDRLTGNIEEVTDQSVRITLPYSGTVTVKREAIKRLVIDRQDKPRATAKGGITLFKDDNDERNAWLWSGSGDLNIRLKHDDKQTHNVNVKGKSELANLDWRYSFYGEYTYETADNVTDSHDYQLNPTLDYFLNQQWFIRTSLNAEYDMLDSDRYLKMDYGSGPGYRFWDDKRQRLELMLQGGVSKLYFREESGVAPIFNGERIIDFPFSGLYWDYREPFSLWQEKLELFSQGRYLRYLAQPSPYFTLNQNINGHIGIRYYFNDHLRLSWSSELEWEDADIHVNGVEQTYRESRFKHLLSLGASF